jgi:hypothetical protein
MTDDTQPIEQAPAAPVVEAEQPVSLPDPSTVPGDTDDTTTAETDAKPVEETDDSDKADDANEDSDDADDVEAEKPKRRSGVQRLKDQNRRLQAEIEAIRASATRAGAPADLDAAIQAEIGPPPREQDFSDYLAFEDAKALWRTEYALTKRDIRGRVEQATTRQQQRIDDLRADYEEGQATARKSISDYDAVLRSAEKAPVAPHVEGLILESEKSALLAYHLAKNQDKLERLNALPPVAAAREIGRLEARLSLPNPNKATAAPKPIAPVKGGASPTKAPAEMSMEEYAAYRAKGGRG